METLNTTKYPNNSRIVAGNVTIFDDDSILLCNTSLGAVTINLSLIPANYWNTTYKLYIKDNSNNASVNNITIVAGTGQTINGGASLVLNTNGINAIIRITSNSTYLASLSYIAPDGYTTIQEEGVSLPQRQILDFQGANVTATDNGVKTIVTITAPVPPPAFDIIDITYAAFNALVVAGTIQKGWFYRITDAQYTDEGVIIQGTTINTNSIQGSGIFLNADYQNVGNYSGVSGFVANLGLWSTIVQPIVVGNVVIYDNLHYKNLTGVWGTAPSSDAVNWVLLAKNTTNGYIKEVDSIRYDLTINSITYRADKRGNEVESNLWGLKWGDNNTYLNKVYSDSRINNRNGYGIVYGNTVSQNSNITNASQYTTTLPTIRWNNLTSGSLSGIYGVNSGIYEYNNLSNQSILSIQNFDSSSYFSLNNMSRSTIQPNNSTVSFVSSSITGCNMSSHGEFQFYGVFQNSTINECVINHKPIVFGNENGINYFRHELSQTTSTFPVVLDMNDGTIFFGTTLTIPTLYLPFGIITLLNCTGKTISRITGINTFTKTFIPTIGETVTFQHTLIGSSGSYDLVCDAPASANLLTGRAQGSDYIEYKISGESNLRSNMVLLA